MDDLLTKLQRTAATQGILDQRHMAGLHHEFMRQVEPYLKLKAEVYAVLIPKIIIVGIEIISQYQLTQAEQSLIDSCDAAINLIRKNIFGDERDLTNSV